MNVVDFIVQVWQVDVFVNVLVGWCVVVIGGGNMVIDVVVQSCKFGVECVMMVYWCGVDVMSVMWVECEFVQKSGVMFVMYVKLVCIVGMDGQVMGVEFEGVLGECFIVDVDMVLKVIGQMFVLDGIVVMLLILDCMWIVVDVDGCMVLLDVWVGGDCVVIDGIDFMVQVVQDGKCVVVLIDVMFVVCDVKVV